MVQIWCRVGGHGKADGEGRQAILTPVAIGFGVDPVHFVIVIVVNLALGMITPPLGVNLFAAAAVTRVPVQRLFGGLVWPIATVLIVLALITYVPAISLGLGWVWMR